MLVPSDYYRIPTGDRCSDKTVSKIWTQAHFPKNSPSPANRNLPTHRNSIIKTQKFDLIIFDLVLLLSSINDTATY